VLPRLLSRRRVIAYDFRDMNAKQVRYWRDVGTLDAYYDANMDLVDVEPLFNLYDRRWPVRTNLTQQPPAKFVFAQEGRRMGVAMDSIVSAGCIVSGGRVLRSVLSPGVRVNSYCEVEFSILLPNAEIGRWSRLRRTIVNTGVKIPESSTIGFDLEADRAKGYTVTEAGVVVVDERMWRTYSCVPRRHSCRRPATQGEDASGRVSTLHARVRAPRHFNQGALLT